MASLRTIELKLDALLEKAGIDPAEVVKPPPPPAPRELSEAEKQAIAAAPKPTPVAGPRTARTTATNAPAVTQSTPPADPVEEDKPKSTGSKRKA